MACPFAHASRKASSSRGMASGSLRQDRLRHQLPRRHGDPDLHRDQHRRPAHQGRAAPASIAITPDGKTAYVSNAGSGTVTPISTATNTPGTPIPVGAEPGPIVISP